MFGVYFRLSLSTNIYHYALGEMVGNDVTIICLWFWVISMQAILNALDYHPTVNDMNSIIDVIFSYFFFVGRIRKRWEMM